MGILIRTAVILAAGAAGWVLAKRRSKQAEEPGEPHVVYLEDDEAVIDAQAEPQPVHAQVLHAYRRMDPITLTGATEVTFALDDGTEVKLLVSGEGSLHLTEGDSGMLTWSGDRLILFEKDNGELVGGMFYGPAQEDSADE